MRRPIPQDSRGFARYMAQQRARQERDERVLHGPLHNADRTLPYAYTLVGRSASGVTEAPDLADNDTGWLLSMMQFQMVNPIALEPGQQLVVGESGVYAVVFDVDVTFDDPTDPDEVFSLTAELAGSDLHGTVVSTTTADSVGTGKTLGLSVTATWPMRIGQSATASFVAEGLVTPPATFSFHAAMSVAWYASVDVPAVGSS